MGYRIWITDMGYGLHIMGNGLRTMGYGYGCCAKRTSLLEAHWLTPSSVHLLAATAANSQQKVIPGTGEGPVVRRRTQTLSGRGFDTWFGLFSEFKRSNRRRMKFRLSDSESSFGGKFGVCPRPINPREERESSKQIRNRATGIFAETLFCEGRSRSSGHLVAEDCCAKRTSLLEAHWLTPSLVHLLAATAANSQQWLRITGYG
jgi:hypothetical protein